MTEYAVIYERAETNWGAIIRELPGCVSIGDTFEEVEANVKEAIELYIGHLESKGLPVPASTVHIGKVRVAS